MAMKLLTTNTSSNAASSSFTSSIDSTYKLYIFKFIDIHSDNDQVNFSFQANATDTADYNDIAMTTTHFAALHMEDDSGAELSYRTASDQAQGTAFQKLTHESGSDADQSCAGELHLFNPSSTTYVKHFYARVHNASADDKSYDHFIAGYFDTTDNIDAIQFKMSSGNMDGVIKMYGVG